MILKSKLTIIRTTFYQIKKKLHTSFSDVIWRAVCLFTVFYLIFSSCSERSFFLRERTQKFFFYLRSNLTLSNNCRFLHCYIRKFKLGEWFLKPLINGLLPYGCRCYGVCMKTNNSSKLWLSRFLEMFTHRLFGCHHLFR